MMGISDVSPTTYYYVPGGDSYVQYVIDLADEVHPPLVNSMSWGSVEQEMYQSTMDAFNTAALQLAAMGVTILVSSGECMCVLVYDGMYIVLLIMKYVTNTYLYMYIYRR